MKRAKGSGAPRGRASREPATAGPRRGAEILGALFILAAAFALVSLVSYDPRDPSWSNASPPGHEIRNFAGRTGAGFAEALVVALGFAAFIFPFALGVVGIRTLFPRRRGRFPLRLASFLTLFVLLCPLLHLLFERIPWRGSEIQAGGLLGQVVCGFLVKSLNTWGTLLALLGGLVLLTLFSTRWSLARTLRFFRRAFQSAAKDVRIRVTRYRKARDKERMRRKVVEKYAAAPPPSGRGAEARKARAARPADADDHAEDPGGHAARKAAKELDKERKRQEKERAREEKKKAKAAKPRPAPAPEKMLFPDLGRSGDYQFPPFSLLDPGVPSEKIDKAELYEKKQRIESKLKEFGVEGEVREYHPGPVITTYEFYPAPGIKVSQVANLSEELSLALEAESVRIQRIPGKSSLGLEIPNNKRETIKLRDILQSEKFLKSPGKLLFAMGKDVVGDPYVSDLSVMPHLLIAGATGMGKSVGLNALIASILYRSTPDEVKLILIDPKHLEFTLYDGIPHLLAPVVNDSKRAGGVLMDAVRKMEERLKQLSQVKVRNIEQYNQLIKETLEDKKGRLTDEERKSLKPMPHIVIIIDELADLMLTGAQDVEFCIARLAQLARAVGIHLVMATQRPSVDVLTGTIKNNFPCRIAFRVPQKIDSRIILDQMGADKLLGNGDMLFLPPNYPRIVRLHCAYISIPEVRRLVKHVKEQATPEYDQRLIDMIQGSGDKSWGGDGDKDELFDECVTMVLTTGQASASWLQRKMKLGYARAARIIDQMEQEGILGPADGSKPREILVDAKSYLSDMRKKAADADR